MHLYTYTYIPSCVHACNMHAQVHATKLTLPVSPLHSSPAPGCLSKTDLRRMDHELQI